MDVIPITKLIILGNYYKVTAMKLIMLIPIGFSEI